jgi:tetratricopeptide (TPR) repeat protein
LQRARLAGSLAVLLLAARALRADTITLTNGRVIEADRAWYQGSQLIYEKNGGVFGLPRSLVKSLDQKTPLEPSKDPELTKARERLAAGDPGEALRLLKPVLARDPNSLGALQAQSEAWLAFGDARKARDAAERAVRQDERNPRSRALLADALSALGDRGGAEAEYRKSLQLHPDAEIQRKLEQLGSLPRPGVPGLPSPSPSTGPTRGAQFRIKYDGGINEPLGMAVLQTLTQAHEEYGRRLGFSPDVPITVVLQTETAFQEAGGPEWAAGVNDGAIRVPVRGMERLTPQLVRVLRHELAHSFIGARTGGNCPTWLQEGISQWLEGGDPARQDGAAAAAARQAKLIALVSLEGPFQNLPPSDAPLAYAESLSAVAYIVKLRGEAGIVRLLAALADQLPSEEAIPVALALSYPELQRSWEQELATKAR